MSSPLSLSPSSAEVKKAWHYTFIPPYVFMEWRKYDFNISKLFSDIRLGLPSYIFPSGFPTKILYVFLISPVRSTCLAHFVLIDSIVLIVFGEECKRSDHDVFHFVHAPVTLGTLFNKYHETYVGLNVLCTVKGKGKVVPVF
jgi:hypothetical protein